MTQNAHGIANRLRILRKDVHSGSFLLVEGHEEKKLYSIFVDRDARKIEIAHGKPNVQGALAILEGESFKGLLALVDTDFDALEGRAVASPNLLRSDTHDLETMLLASPALDKVLSKALVVVDAELLNGARALEDPSHDRWHVCCGHDLVRILSVGLLHVWGSNKPADIEPGRLEESLRLAFSRADFESTRLFAGIVAWEAVSAPYVIVKR